MQQALVIATDTEELSNLALVVQRIGMSVLRSVDLQQALEKWGAVSLDLILISFDGPISLDHIRNLRGITGVPLALLVDNIPESVQVSLLDSGADIIITRPTSPRLLRAKLQALLRRVSGMPIKMLPSLTVGAVVLEPTARAVQVGNSDLTRLTNLEFRLLYTLMVHRGQILSSQQLVEHVWGYSGDKDRDLVRNLVRRLRAKIEDDPKQPAILVTVPGVGYVFQPE